MNFLTFEPQSTSTPKKLNASMFTPPNLCSTPRPAHVRYSLSKCAPLPVDSSTPNSKRIKKTFAPDIHRLVYPSKLTGNQPMKIWVI